MDNVVKRIDLALRAADLLLKFLYFKLILFLYRMMNCWLFDVLRCVTIITTYVSCLKK